MSSHWGGLIELLVVLSFVLGWGVLELVVLWRDRRREAQESASTRPARHAEGQ